MRHLIALVALVGCESAGGGAGGGTAGAKVAETGTKRGSAGGFSATLAKEMGPPEGALGAAAPGADLAASGATGSGAGSGAAQASGAASGAGAASEAQAAGSGGTTEPVAADSSANAGGAGASAAGETSGGAEGATSGGAGAGTSGGAATSKAGASDSSSTVAQGATSGTGAVVQTKAGALPAATPPPGQSTAPATAGNVGAAVAPSPDRAPVKPSAELAAIKFDLEPNWERDVGEAGTFSLVVKLPKTSEQRVFVVRYGYEDPAAPFDCDQYRKYLDENKIMAVTLNRQSGAACYIEGTEQNGVAAYRFLINYGGKRLLCRGSLYKDPSSSALGDLRDKVLMQAKTICKTMTL